MKQQVAVIGLGRFGSAVATELVRMGHEVLGIDNNLDVVQDLSDVLSHVVQAEATDEETLERLGLGEFDSVVIGITQNLETSILTALMAKRLGVKRVIVKARNEMHGEILTRVGADRVIFPERDTGIRLAHSWTSSDITDSLDVVEGYAVSKVAVPEEMVGKTIADMMPASTSGVTLMLIARGSRVTVYPPPDTRLQRDDVLVMAGEYASMERFFSEIMR